MYFVKLNNELIGTTKLENTDVSMGMVYGEINFINIISPYSFFKSFSQKFDIELAIDYPDDKVLKTRIIPQLKIYNPKHEIIQGQGYITGMDNSDFQIEFRISDSDLMQKEFYHHF